MKNNLTKYLLWALLSSFFVEGILVIQGDTGGLSKFSFVLFCLVFLFWFVVNFRFKLESFLAIKAKGGFMPLVRVSYACLSLFTGVQHATLISSGLEPYNFSLLGWEVGPGFSFAMTAGYLLALVLVLFGVYLRVAWIAVFVLGAFIIPFSLEIFLKNIFCFYAIFISPKFWRGESNEDHGWPILLMGISATFLTTGAGLFKLLDPVWQSGLGFYYSMNIPFFPPKHLWPMLDNKWLVITLNWVTIIAEFIAFPLFIFRRTRLFGILGVAGLGLFLSYPMAGIGIVGGPIVIVLAITLSTLIERDNFFFGTLNKVGIFLRQLSLNIRSFDFAFFTNSWMKYIIFLWTFSGVLFWTIKRIPNIVYKPPVFGSFINTKPPVILIPYSIQYRLGMTTKVLEKTRPHRHFEFIWLLDLFDYPHLFDRVIFKVEFNLKDAGVVEPRKFFNENGSYSNDYPLLFNERFLLTCWRIMEFHQGGGTDSNDLTPGQRNEILALIRYCAEKLERDVFESATVSIKGLYQPKEYSGNKKSWEDKDWLPFIRYESDKRKLEVLNTLARYNFSQLEIDSFKKEILVPKYE